ncbi:MAG: hypothetical protein KC636_15995 [Myxococcales bacterium]|nr:hypothetical protein [Myxococcales bacterium]
MSSESAALTLLARRGRRVAVFQLIATIGALIMIVAWLAFTVEPRRILIWLLLGVWPVTLVLGLAALQAVHTLRSSAALRRVADGDREALGPALDRLRRGLRLEVLFAWLLSIPLGGVLLYLGLLARGGAP